MNRPMDLLLKYQEIEFAAAEVRLYLDTHPFDQRAQCDFKRYTYQMMMMRPQLERIFGPLTHEYSQENPARWVEEPWPWELIY
ncbi:spore coat protein CotJB [Tepidibacillus fermentans]|uniref:Spore coat protein JB n=1 Tax=Tepidibacillus fermentans TaxID=1281767 RepID=A0A4R3KJZ9_9BACI|nr:spore coat protein CotJB [Tepidibacillus fermentans]TCS83695.1 spore coat protein JB [Tepidibacillus fermentans]